MIFLFATGCASTLESVNKGAEKVGETGGKIMRVPHSVGEGAASGIAGDPESNPYGR
jgi:predicted enzyme related to lactoylglutathione lyase